MPEFPGVEGMGVMGRYGLRHVHGVSRLDIEVGGT
jgi:hypothetical protein